MTTHGHSVGRTSRTYNSWSNMIQRCQNEKTEAFKRYGARGISVCSTWSKFSNFLSDMGERPSGMTLGRKDNNGPYCKANCQWETKSQQSANTRQNRFIEFRGERLHLSGWARKLGANTRSLHGRIGRMGVETALSFYADKL